MEKRNLQRRGMFILGKFVVSKTLSILKINRSFYNHYVNTDQTNVTRNNSFKTVGELFA